MSDQDTKRAKGTDMYFDKEILNSFRNKFKKIDRSDTIVSVQTGLIGSNHTVRISKKSKPSIFLETSVCVDISDDMDKQKILNSIKHELIKEIYD